MKKTSLNKNQKKTLSVQIETLRELTTEQLVDVAGGRPASMMTECSNTCPTRYAASCLCTG